MLAYTTVRHVIAQSIPDYEGSYDDVTGTITFTPDIPRGEVWQWTDEEGTKTVPPIPVECKIVNGVLHHNGSPAVQLFAGGPNSNPSVVHWRVAFLNVKAGGEFVKIHPFVFKAVPDETIDLARVMPVSGYTPPGIIKGDKGDTGDQGVLVDEDREKVEIAVAGLADLDRVTEVNKGHRDDSIEAAGMSLTAAELAMIALGVEHPIRIDDSVGKRIFVGDTMVYGDTGQRDVSQLIEGLVEGRILMRRVGEVVQWTFRNFSALDQDPSWNQWDFSFAGFRPDNHLYFASAPRGSAHSVGPIRIGNNDRIYAYKAKPQMKFEATFSYFTEDEWPSSLPGTPA